MWVEFVVVLTLPQEFSLGTLFFSFHKIPYLQIPIPGPAWKPAKTDVVPSVDIENSFIFLVNFSFCEIVLNVAYIVMVKGPSF